MVHHFYIYCTYSDFLVANYSKLRDIVRDFDFFSSIVFQGKKKIWVPKSLEGGRAAWTKANRIFHQEAMLGIQRVCEVNKLYEGVNGVDGLREVFFMPMTLFFGVLTTFQKWPQNRKVSFSFLDWKNSLDIIWQKLYLLHLKFAKEQQLLLWNNPTKYPKTFKLHFSYS